MKKTILLAVTLCATVAATAQQNTSGSIYNPDFNYDRTNFVEQGLDASQQNNRADIRQGGNAETKIIQNGSTGNVDLNQARYNGIDNFVNIRQFGSFNSVYSLQEGESNRAGVSQNNDNNTADIFQLGSFNSERINQFGTMNFSSVGQLGSQNLLEITQGANGGFVDFVQIGQANDARIEQVFGINNKLSVVQFSGEPGYLGNGYYGGGLGGNGPGIGNNAFVKVQDFLNQYGGIILDGNGYPSSGNIGNYFQINQSGEMNLTDVAQIGRGNKLEISQDGFSNKIIGLDIYNGSGPEGLTGIQAGVDNYGILRQTGLDNVIQYSQLGINSKVDFEQNGNGNFGRVIVSMNSNLPILP